MFGRKVLAELRAAVYLAAVEHCAGKREAARKMNVSVDTLSKYIEMLEEECGTELLCTVGNGSQLTSRGKRLVSYVAGIEQALQHMYAVTSNKDELEGDIHLLWNRNIRTSIIYSDLWAFLKRHKQLTIYSTSVSSETDISGYDYDVALVSTLPTDDDWELVYSKAIRFGFFATGQYLKKHGYPVDLADMLQKHQMIFKQDVVSWLENGENLVNNAQHKAYVSDTSFMVKDGIENDVGIGLLPLSFVRYGLVCLDNIPCKTNAYVYVVVKKAKRSDPRIGLVCEYMKEILSRA